MIPSSLLLLLLLVSTVVVVVVNADVHTYRYATYNTSSKLGPWAPPVLNENNESWNINITNPVWCLQNNPITEERNEDTNQVGQAEECLLLRVFRPDNYTTTTMLDDDGNTTNDSHLLLPVLIWIYGGMYVLGSGVKEDLYYGGFLANQENIIVVTINYRLGAHGFLGYSGTYGSAVNTGIHDQQVALEWTVKYIRELGGDPNRITLAGESAGATSVNIHMAHPTTNRLFQQAILESNPAGINLKDSVDQKGLFIKLAHKMGCRHGTTMDEQMDCLVEMSKDATNMAKIIAESQKVTYTNSLFHLDIWMSFYTWAPSVDDDLVLGQPNKVVLEQWTVDENKPVLMGTNEDEARFFMTMICQILGAVSDKLPGNFIKCNYEGTFWEGSLFKDLMYIAFGWDTFKIDNYYRFDKDSDETAIAQFTKLVTDSVFNCPNYDMARDLSSINNTNTYLYRYAVDAICSVASTTSDCEGYSCHGDEIATVFGTYGVTSVAEYGNCTSENVQDLEPFVQFLQRPWGQFVRTGGVNNNNWSTMADNQKVHYFAQDSNTMMPLEYEGDLTTHNTHQENQDNSATDICQMWAKHTYKTESRSGGTTLLLFGYSAMMMMMMMMWLSTTLLLIVGY